MEILKPTAIVNKYDMSPYGGSSGIEVAVDWGETVDRRISGGIVVNSVNPKTARQLVKRLVKAINAGVVYTNPKICKDLFGQTYVDAECRVVGRKLSADLKRLGF